MDQQQILANIDHAMTEIDLALWNWQTDLDMMSFIGQDIPVRILTPTDVLDVTYTRHPLPAMQGKIEIVEAAAKPEKITRVPLVKYVGRDRIVIGIADVDQSNGVMRAEVYDWDKELLSIPTAFSISDEDPPVLDHTEIKAQLRDLVGPHLYSNPYTFKPVLPKSILHEYSELGDHLDNHPFFKNTEQ